LTNYQGTTSPALDEDLIWAVRTYVYRQFSLIARPPSTSETAAQFQISLEQAMTVHEELHERHTLYLDRDTRSIRMANPFSAVPTPFRVFSNADGTSATRTAYFANCAWDMLGIPAALHNDAEIEATCAHSGDPVSITVKDGRVSGNDELVHFLVPFRHWYDDLVFT
jgi:hypothetical protein